MSRRLKIPSPWAQLGLFMLLLGGCLIFTSILLGSTFGYPAKTLALNKLEQTLSSIGVFALPSFLYAVMTTNDRRMDFLGLRKAQLPVFYVMGVILLLLSFPFEGWLGQLNKHIPLADWMIRDEKDATARLTEFLKAGSGADVAINVVFIALAPAICEELCFRGALQRILIQCFRSPWAGILATAAFFSAFHMQFQGFLPRMFMGTLLGAAYWYSGSLWVAILGHFFVNGVQVIAASYYPGMIEQDPYVPIYWALISLAIVVGLLSVFHRRSKTSFAEVYAHQEPYTGFPERTN